MDERTAVAIDTLGAAKTLLDRNAFYSDARMVDEAIAELQRLSDLVESKDRPTEPGWYACFPRPGSQLRAVLLYLTAEDIAEGKPNLKRIVYGPIPKGPPDGT